MLTLDTPWTLPLYPTRWGSGLPAPQEAAGKHLFLQVADSPALPWVQTTLEEKHYLGRKVHQRTRPMAREVRRNKDLLITFARPLRHLTHGERDEILEASRANQQQRRRRAALDFEQHARQLPLFSRLIPVPSLDDLGLPTPPHQGGRDALGDGAPPCDESDEGNRSLRAA